jgi:hypothetical protein
LKTDPQPDDCSLGTASDELSLSVRADEFRIDNLRQRLDFRTIRDPTSRSAPAAAEARLILLGTRLVRHVTLRSQNTRPLRAADIGVRNI